MENYVKIFDTTLRDGEQCPGAAMSEDEKLQIAHLLAKMNVDVIEAWFPVSSPVQFQAVERIAREINGPTIAALARAIRIDIETAFKAIKPAEKRRIHTFLATSPIHMKHKLGKTPAEVLKLAREAVMMAREYVSDVEFSPEDGTRSDWEFLREVCEAVIEAGVTTINVPDTVGYSTPELYGEMFAYLIKNVKGADKITFSAHCHNDLGLATANSLSAVKNGVRQVECTINGIGERAGNTAMEEVVMALRTRKDYYKITTNIDTGLISKASHLVKTITGMVVQPNKAIVGANAFAHESGIHQDGVIKNRETYEIMTPQSIGLESNRMVLGRHSGRAGFKDRIIRLGYDAKPEEIESAYTKFLEIADKKKEVFDEDIIALFTSQAMTSNQKKYSLVYYEVKHGTNTKPTATIKMKLENSNIVEMTCSGNGPVDAIFTAIEKIVGIKPILSKLLISPVTEGTDAFAESSVSIIYENKTVVGKGSSTDIIEAAAVSYIDALNRL